VLCDIAMPGLDGYATLEALRQHSVTASLPFIFMTGKPDQEGMRHGMELGADDYLPKPFRVAQLLAAVRARLKKEQNVRERAESKLEELRSNISLSLPHELLTPLNGILGFAELLAADARDMQPDQVVAMAQMIRESGKRLHRMIKNFLLLAQLCAQDASRPAPLRDAQAFDPAPWVREVAQEKARAAKREADLVLDLQPAPAYIKEEYFSKIAEELLDNAFKFSTAGSPVRAQLELQGDHAILRVSDRGRGIKPEHIAEIGAYMQFERKLHEQQGSGLGLAVARRFAELHGGALNVSSEVGVGTAVEVRLPAAAVPPR
jgi:signal transduction histidine kinase